MKIEKLMPLWLIGLYPLALILGTLVSEIINVLLILLFIFFSIKNKIIIKFDDPIIYFLIFLWIYLLINLFFSIDSVLSLNRSIFFIKYPLLILSINYFLTHNSENIRIIFKIWFITLVITIIDLYFQFFFGQNILGFKSPWDARLSGFFKDELKVAHLLIGFFLPTFAFYLSKNPKKISLYFFFIIYLLVLVLTNERANIIRGSLILFFFLLFYPFIKIKLKILILTIFVGIFSGSIYFIDTVNQRFVKEIQNMNKNIEDKKPFNLIILSNYGPHYLTSIEIFKKHKLFGSGIKTFRKACKDVSIDKYFKDDKTIRVGCSTHPHQYYFEFLSELGILGLIIFISFFIYVLYRVINSYIRSKNLILLSVGLFFSVHLIPLIPTGSFFTSFGATIFFINLSLIFYYTKKY